MHSDKILFGLHCVEQVLSEQSDQVLNLYFDKERRDMRIQNIIDMAKEYGIKTQAITKQKLDDMAESTHHQGVIVRLAQPRNYTEKEILELIKNQPNALVVILDCVQDPHNLGACMRSALALGATALVVPQNKSCPMTATVSKVASGAAERLPFLAVKNLARFMVKLKEMGIWCVGTSLQTNQFLHEIDLTGPIAIVMGSEASGIRELTQKQCDYVAKIPLIGPMESLNVSVATGISLYEVYRQRLAR